MKSYALDQSPLYLLGSRRKLAELLELTAPELEGLANGGTANYTFFDTKPKNGKKPRHVEWPNPSLRKVQRSLARILGSIKPPTYLHSAFRGRSYITNAAGHDYVLPSAKIDIRKFFESAQSSRVSRAFRDQFGCSPDVAMILAKLMTLSGHVPTGGNSSTMISFWAYKPMFDEIHQLAVDHGLTMTCCVDDMTFSGRRATRGFINKVRLIIRRYGLRTHKEKYFPASSPKIVTGVAITTNGARLPNQRRLRLHRAFAEVELVSNPKERVKQAEALLGRATEAEQIESRFRSEVFLATKILKSARSAIRRGNNAPG